MSEPGNPAVGSGDAADPADEALALELAAALADHRAPSDVTAAAKALFTWRTVDAELAALVFDSLVDEEELQVRSVAGPRTVAFAAGDTEIEIEIVPGAEGRRLVGQTVPAAAAEVEISVDGRSSTAVVDQLGRFSADLPVTRVRVAVGLVRAGERTVRTAPILL
ncbi:hypothetical protein GCM10009836_59340 [Pseudonocardia ailaonensis]|uniref:Uncharacterized protein n=1 Tax=Pseudonocardia ailaonensis TaxID=367279 RepID=A0ABN2NII7_9PSEU